MKWREQFVPAEMQRVVVVAPETRIRDVLVEVADTGVFEPDPATGHGDEQSPFRLLADRLQIDPGQVEPRVSASAIGVDELESSGDQGLIVGEAELDERVRATETVHRCAVQPGWIPRREAEALHAQIAPLGGAIAEIPVRRGLVTPTAHTEGGVSDSFRPLVTTYGTAPARDLDPTMFAAVTYMVMFGMMFGDVAHGLAIVVLGLVARRLSSERWQSVRAVAPFLIGAGISAMIFGLLYGEAFGPTGLVPTLWARPLDDPEQLLVAGLVLGTFLLAATFIGAVVNRWRESGPGVAIYDASGIAGALLFAGVVALVGGVAMSVPWLRAAGWVLLAVGGVLAFVGLIVKAGPGGAGVAEAGVEMFDTLLRLGSNMVSFARLAAFGLTHAVIAEVVWDGTLALWGRGTVLAYAAAIVLFSLGNLAAFSLGALVGAIQALRLEYYELFSRLFVDQGRPFRPWHIPTKRLETS
ncbi:MAG: V-type ATPase 116kDa subunit family protein [Ilumatobacteraceae bacterium]